MKDDEKKELMLLKAQTEMSVLIDYINSYPDNYVQSIELCFSALNKTVDKDIEQSYEKIIASWSGLANHSWNTVLDIIQDTDIEQKRINSIIQEHITNKIDYCNLQASDLSNKAISNIIKKYNEHIAKFRDIDPRFDIQKYLVPIPSPKNGETYQVTIESPIIMPPIPIKLQAISPELSKKIGDTILREVVKKIPNALLPVIDGPILPFGDIIFVIIMTHEFYNMKTDMENLKKTIVEVTTEYLKEQSTISNELAKKNVEETKALLLTISEILRTNFLEHLESVK